MTIQSLRVRPVLFAVACGLLLMASAAAGAAEGGSSDADEARAFHEKAKAAFALSHYSQAAEFFEKAFELKSDPALLYNAAQSHRLAGNKQRALTLYQNYLHVYGRDDRRAQIEMRIDELKKAIEKDRTEVPVAPPAGWPPGTTGPGPAASKTGASTPPNLRVAEPAKPLSPPPPATPARVAPPPAPMALAPMPATAPPAAVEPATSSIPSSPTLLTQSSSSGNEERSLTQKPWFWVAVGGGVAAAVAVVLLVSLSKSKDPSASFGQINGN